MAVAKNGRNADVPMAKSRRNTHDYLQINWIAWRAGVCPGVALSALVRPSTRAALWAGLGGVRDKKLTTGAGQHLPRCWATGSKYPTCAFLANAHLPCWHSASSNAPAGPGYTLKRQPTKRGQEHTTKTHNVPSSCQVLSHALSSLLPTPYRRTCYIVVLL